MEIKPVHTATCHCGAVELEVELPNGLEEVRRCNCSMCRRKGTVVALVPLERIRIIRGRDKLGGYQFNTMVARHYFCSICGISTHHLLPSNPYMCAVNVGCLEGVNPFELKDIPVADGASLFSRD